ncbi:MAG: DUF5681 domain-containing protein [Acidobacteriota bacterium]|nr:DUF5681 domain-containing protein [Acidobacteriota bacterium]
MPSDEQSYKVGYGKPPVSRRFAKGQSGNPKGRPKGSKNLATIVLRESRQPVRINGPRGSRSVTKLEATVMQLGNKAAQGDIRSQREFISLVRTSEDATQLGVSPQTTHEMDQKVMQNLLRRMARSVDAGTSTNVETKGKESE